MERLGLPLRDWVERHDPRLEDTAAAQPLIFLDSLERLDALDRRGITAEAATGHSLGEYAALVCCGILSATQATTLVLERGRRMSGVEGGMAALLKLPADEVETLCRSVGDDVVIANYNTPLQVVISGRVDAVSRVAALAESRGGRAVRLKVSGPFHSPFMKPAEDALRPAILRAQFEVPASSFVSSATGMQESSPAHIKEVLAAQITSPVRWVDAIRTLEALGVDRAVEVGSGNTLTNMGKRITTAIEFVTYEEALDG